MRKVRPEEGGATDLGTWMQGPEQIYVAIAIQPPVDTQIITVHRTRDGANRQIESYATAWQVASVQGTVEQLPLLP